MYLDISVIASIVLVALMVGGTVFGTIFVRGAMKRDAKNSDR
ncbi:hypothetical protein [Halomonas halocynthiae]|nr:hypothetical protein [Halomonas halocynthiae]